MQCKTWLALQAPSAVEIVVSNMVRIVVPNLVEMVLTNVVEKGYKIAPVELEPSEVSHLRWNDHDFLRL